MSLFGRAIAGAGGAAANLAQQYITAEMEHQKAQALADIQMAQTQRTEEYMQSEPVQGRRRDNAAKAVGSEAAARRGAELEGLNDPTYRGAKRAAADEDAAAETQRKVDALKALTPAEIERIKQIMPVDVERTRLMEEARSRANAKFREPRADPLADLQRKMDFIDKTDALTPEEKAAAKKSLLGVAKARDPELDYETVKTSVPDPKDPTKTTETTLKRVRRPGAMGGDADAADPIKTAMDAARAAKEAGKPKGQPPTTQVPRPGPALETTKAASGATMYRYAGQQQWYPTKERALADLGRNSSGGVDAAGFEPY